MSSGLVCTGASVACTGASVSADGMLHARRMKTAVIKKNVNVRSDDLFFMITLPVLCSVFDYMNIAVLEHPTIGG
jgi:hypothetical protein